jgi:hypothetical protein
MIFDVRTVAQDLIVFPILQPDTVWFRKMVRVNHSVTVKVIGKEDDSSSCLQVPVNHVHRALN